ncbi:MAG: SPOR domain-containing protein [Deltaproteobacteria bacterium]|nr:SPOR domain-containing protein [Deltaproteobacteria bacterium]
MTKSKKSSKKRGKSHAIELSAKAAFFWGLCLFFLLAWIFVLGIFVGRGFVPNGMQGITELKTQIAKLQGLIGHKDSSRPEISQKSFEDPKLAFYENLSTKKKAVARSQLPAERKKLPKKPVVHGVNKAKKQAAREKAATPTAGNFTVQIASLGVEEKAKVLVKTLTAKGYPAYFYEAKVKGSPRFRVRCGSFKTAEEAKGFARELFKAEKIKGFVLRAEK